LAAAYHLDSAVGEIVEALDRTGQRENTLILFSSDNGPQGRWPGNAYPDDLKLTDFNQPLPMKGMKLDVWEGGIHVPGFANWPGRITPKKVSDAVHIVDWFPTLAKLIQYQPAAPVPWDGVDLTPVIFSDESLAHRDLYWTWNHRTNRWAIRMGEWKIVKYGEGAPQSETDWQLFNLTNDPAESDNVATQHAEIGAHLHQRFLLQRKRDRQQK
jgi:arylsulfatase A-like enzyme